MTALSTRSWQLMLLSARTLDELELKTHRLKQICASSCQGSLPDIGHTIRMGCGKLAYRSAMVLNCQEGITDILKARSPISVQEHILGQSKPPIVFLFPGQGSQMVNMARELYENELHFQAQCDLGFTIFQDHFQLDLKAVLYPQDQADVSAMAQRLKQTELTQPALFIVEYALSQLWLYWGVNPVAMLGHSVGEYVAACVAGIFSFEEALCLVAARGKLMQACKPGSMLLVYLAAQELAERLPNGALSVAVSNGPKLSVAAGPTNEIEAFEQQLMAQNIYCRQLHTSHAFHSHMMTPALEPFAKVVSNVNRQPPRVPVVSNRSGSWLTNAEAVSVNYWVDHLRHPVKFSEGVQTLLQLEHPIFLEVGPGRTLSSLVKQQGNNITALQSLPHPREEVAQLRRLMMTVGELWLTGVSFDWSSFCEYESNNTVLLKNF
ncbi:MAG: acyltransferase domain-containing protein [Cyanobacteria bacterium P01_H01_bin.105]